MTGVRAARALIPGAVKRAHERWSTQRYERTASALNARWIERHGTVVEAGPFAGLRYPPALARTTHDVVAKLAGTYELELHDVLAGWIAVAPPVVVDVGCAEGLYAVGLALKAPGTTVHAVDVDAGARERCARLARENRVADRVRVRERLGPGDLAGFPADGVRLLVDAEGYERELLDPVAAPRLAGWEVLVELHDFLDPAISATILERFAPTHDVRLIDGADRGALAPAALAELAPAERALVLGERRPAPMQWGWLRPRA